MLPCLVPFVCCHTSPLELTDHWILAGWRVRPDGHRGGGLHLQHLHKTDLSLLLLRGGLDIHAFRLGISQLLPEDGRDRADGSFVEWCLYCTVMLHVCPPPTHKACSLTRTCATAGQMVMNQWINDCPVGREGKLDIPVVSCHGYRSQESMYAFYNSTTVPALRQ